MACKICSTMPNSADPEKLFSQMGRIISRDRTRLLESRVAQMLVSSADARMEKEGKRRLVPQLRPKQERIPGMILALVRLRSRVIASFASMFTEWNTTISTTTEFEHVAIFSSDLGSEYIHGSGYEGLEGNETAVEDGDGEEFSMDHEDHAASLEESEMKTLALNNFATYSESISLVLEAEEIGELPPIINYGMGEELDILEQEDKEREMRADSLELFSKGMLPIMGD